MESSIPSVSYNFFYLLFYIASWALRRRCLCNVYILMSDETWEARSQLDSNLQTFQRAELFFTYNIIITEIFTCQRDMSTPGINNLLQKVIISIQIPPYGISCLFLSFSGKWKQQQKRQMKKIQHIHHKNIIMKP